MAENDTWQTLGAAAVATGWKPERIRSLARRGTIERKRGNGRDWLYRLPPELVANRAAARADTTADPRAGTDKTARWQAVAAELEAEIGDLRVELGRVEERVAARDQRIVDLVDRLNREIARADRIEVELHRSWLDRLRELFRR